MISPCVVAFPRSGTHFLRKALGYSQGLSGQDLENFYINGYNDHEPELIYYVDAPVVTILRHPKDCIPSAMILGTIMMGLDLKPDSFELNAKQYLTFYRIATANINNIYPILFEQLSDNLNKVLENIILTLGGEIIYLDAEKAIKDMVTRDANNQPKMVASSSKNHQRYEEMISIYNNMDESLIDELENSYINFKDEILKRQQDLGWTW